MVLLAVGVTCAVVAAAAGGYLYGHRTSATATHAAGATGAARSAPAAARPYQLTAPKSVLSGAYVVDPEMTPPASETDVRDYAALGIANPVPVSVAYKSASTASKQTAQLTGAWGTISDPEKAVDRHFAKSARDNAATPNGGAALVGSPQTMHPSGLGDAVMKCQNLRVKLGSGHTVTSPVCAWADHSTFGVVMVFDPASLRNGGTGVSLGENADTAARIRNDARVPR
ncbi:hypothetical protein [Streptomyces sp. TLI_146]|uniref:hypothetical protein n=1 Tax=Streptomyces sp. TLI_146 TaxID=1938858 RepID=UPI000CC811D4|nr:hypothetical protein [Streptomyces sp. TLI_146]PKV90135.1 hypothetical protein BX283_7810 [Streptomyces sp. TLI_146]